MTNLLDRISPEYTEVDFSQHPAIIQLGLADNPEVALLVMYDAQNGKIYVDKRAAQDYKVLAAFHEEACQKGLHEDLIPCMQDGDYRCASIEAFIIGQLPPVIGAQYRARRKAMFKLLLDNGMATPELMKSFLNSIRALS